MQYDVVHACPPINQNSETKWTGLYDRYCLPLPRLLKLLWFKNFLLLQILTRVLYITWAIHSKQLDILHWNEHWSAHNFPCQVAKSPVEHLRHLRWCFSHPIEKYAHQNASQSSSILRVKLQINNRNCDPGPPVTWKLLRVNGPNAN